jgi:hypothetical protein
MTSEGKHTTSGADLDVEGSDAELLAAGGDVLGSQHGGVRGRLVTVGLDLHATSNTGDGLTAAGNHPVLASLISLMSDCLLHLFPLALLGLASCVFLFLFQ